MSTLRGPARRQELWAELMADLEALERRAARLMRPRIRRSPWEQLAAIVNYCRFGRWPGETPYHTDPDE